MIIEKKELLKKINFQEAYINKRTNRFELYFTLPKEYLKILLKRVYIDADVSTLCLVIDKEYPNVQYVNCRYSPTKWYEDRIIDYEWNEIKLPKNDIMFLIELYKLIKKYTKKICS